MKMTLTDKKNVKYLRNHTRNTNANNTKHVNAYDFFVYIKYEYIYDYDTNCFVQLLGQMILINWADKP